jgi:hypothetical protein
MKRGDYDGAIKCFEVACPIMEIMPYSSLRKTSDQIAACFQQMKAAHAAAPPRHSPLTDSDSQEYQDLVDSIRVPYQRLEFEFKYKDNMKNVSELSPELVTFVKRFVRGFSGPSILLTSFLAADVIESAMGGKVGI